MCIPNILWINITTLERPQLEYASTVFSPHTAADISKLEAVQRRSACCATGDCQRTSSVTQMIKDLNCRTLEQRRADSRCSNNQSFYFHYYVVFYCHNSMSLYYHLSN